MTAIICIACVCMLVIRVGCLPVIPQQTTPQVEEDGDFSRYNVSYQRYIQEVVDALRSDPNFEAKLRNAQVEDIQTGKIAEGLDVVSSDVRSRLDFIKQSEIERIRDKLEDANRQHMDLSNPSFEKEDLQKLLQKVHALLSEALMCVYFSKDMEKLDKQREAALKERQKMVEEEEYRKLSKLNTEERRAALETMRKAQEQDRNDRKLKHPGSKDQLEEVWENVDQMPKENFDLKTFFKLHDINSDGYWDENEVEALFDKELNEVYNTSDPYQLAQKDMERMKMRQHVFSEVDKNSDSLISYEEFLGESKTADFDNDDKWQAMDKKPAFTEEELERYEEEWRQEAVRVASTVPMYPVDPSGLSQPPSSIDAAVNHQRKQAIDMTDQPLNAPVHKKGDEGVDKFRKQNVPMVHSPGNVHLKPLGPAVPGIP
ncbi:unnamed protein product [Soboliphyme baturini]|uniref:EF-hand domain-containing protein n=1 Tax=Soboliphyme baturini TaxID=241478 RepID=A0A183J4E4_9BILA|nr:unnamed protein product [Soboliphyme baturini]